jgi:PKD repeat protein
MNKGLALVAFTWLVFGRIAFGQVTISQSDMPQVNDSLRFSTANPLLTELDSISEGGPNRIWNFTSLIPTRQDVARYQSALSINITYGVFFGFNSYGRKVLDSIGFGAFQAQNIYDFYRRSASKLEIVGRGATFSGISIPSNYSNNDEQYYLPITYLRNDTGTYKVSFTLPGVGSLIQTGSRRVLADGWGTITTPYGTYQALRVVSKVIRVDSIISSQLPIPIGFTTINYIYQWLAPGQRYPILEIESADVFGVRTVNAVRYRDIYRRIVPLAPTANFFAFDTDIDVGDSVLFFNLSQGQGLRYQWSNVPATGWQFGGGSSAGTANPFIKYTQAGVYSVRLQATNSGGTSDTLRRDYIRVNPAVGVESKFEKNSQWLYPNPSSNEVTLNLPGNGWEVELYSAHGSLVNRKMNIDNQSGRSLVLDGLPAGAYVLKAWRGSERRSTKIIVR